eukprot:m.115994 g.115994  ORF g.115994 m.115994 type:complete len:211 (-) comp17162_c0_seq2:251-883(-)
MKCSLFVAVAAVALTAADAISFHLPYGKNLCLQEDVQKDVLVVGEYNVGNIHGESRVVFDITIEITDSRKHRVYHKEKAVTGKFAFTSDEYDTFSICFSSADNGNVNDKLTAEVTIDIKTGTEARSYDELAKVEKLKPMELELRRLEDLTESIVNNFARMTVREEAHRDTNESTNERMLHFSIFSILCLLVLAIWQVMYLKAYFKQKKLI